MTMTKKNGGKKGMTPSKSPKGSSGKGKKESGKGKSRGGGQQQQSKPTGANTYKPPHSLRADRLGRTVTLTATLHHVPLNLVSLEVLQDQVILSSGERCPRTFSITCAYPEGLTCEAPDSAEATANGQVLRCVIPVVADSTYAAGRKNVVVGATTTATTTTAAAASGGKESVAKPGRRNAVAPGEAEEIAKRFRSAAADADGGADARGKKRRRDGGDAGENKKTKKKKFVADTASLLAMASSVVSEADRVESEKSAAVEAREAKIAAAEEKRVRRGEERERAKSRALDHVNQELKRLSGDSADKGAEGSKGEKKKKGKSRASGGGGGKGVRWDDNAIAKEHKETGRKRRRKD